MTKRIEVEKLDRNIKDGEIRIRTVKANVDLLSKEIEMLAQLEGQLVENIHFLKKNKIVATASEYKKAKEDLNRTRTRTIALKNDREHFKKAIADVEKAIQKTLAELDKLKHESDNVLRGNFGGKNNGKR